MSGENYKIRTSWWKTSILNYTHGKTVGAAILQFPLSLLCAVQYFTKYNAKLGMVTTETSHTLPHPIGMTDVVLEPLYPLREVQQ